MMTKVQHSTGKLIDIHDDLFSYDQRRDIFDFVQRSFYRVGGSDSSSQSQDQQLYSSYTMEDIERSGFMRGTGFSSLEQQYALDRREIKQIRVNLTTNSERNRIHTDRQGLTLLYYVNLQWQIDWAGHTLFLDDQAQRAEHTCLFQPGRVVVFDGTIPHMIITPSNLCPQLRFTLAIQYSEET